MASTKDKEEFTPNPSSLDGVEDLCQMQYLGEENVLHNLAYRYERSQISTATTSKVLIVVNPYEKFEGVDSRETMQKYHNLPADTEGLMDNKDTPPNVFGCAHVAYCNLINLKVNQSMIVCGESGAGKTESAKLIMRFLAFSSTANETDPQKYQDAENVGNMVLDANPILESFGNAKTVLNNNSSRFGKFTKMLFEEHQTDNGPTRTLIGSYIETYLLEKSRIVRQDPGERNFHSFYYLTTSLGKECFPECAISGTSADYHYTSQSGTYFKTGEHKPNEDTDDLDELLKAFRTLGFTKDQQTQVFRIVAGILHLGNIRFTEQKSGVSIANPDVLTKCAQVFQVDEKKLSRRLTHQSLMVVDKMVEKELNGTDAVFNRDSIAKTVYSTLFDALVTHINKQSVAETKTCLWIGTLDVFGFEIFENNSFEQFCINFANERLQQFFNYHVLHAEQTLYLKESLIWQPVDLPDNQDVIDLVMNRGIISILDSSCVSKGNDKTFVENLFKVRPHMRMRKVVKRAGKSTGGQFIAMNGFSIQHYAGTVTYNAEDFLVKNGDQVVPDTVKLFQGSSNPVLASIFPAEQPDAKKTGGVMAAVKRAAPSNPQRAFKSVGQTFVDQLHSLMTALDETNPFFIRCIKPNTVKKPKNFDPEYVRPQLRCGGLIQALKIIKLGFPVRCSYAKIWQIFGSILNGYSTPSNINFRDFTEAIMMKLGDRELDPDEYQLGLTMVFFRPGKQAFLQAILAKDPSSVSSRSVDAIREFMNYKRIIRTRGALRTSVRLSRYVIRRRLLAIVNATRISQRTLGRALAKARDAVAANSEEAKEKARQAERDKLAAIENGRNAEKLKKLLEEKELDFQRKLDAEASKLAELKEAEKAAKAKTATFMSSLKEAKEELSAEKVKTLNALRDLDGLRDKLSSAQREADGLKEQINRCNAAIKDKENRIAAMESEKELLSTRSKADVDATYRALRDAEAKNIELREELQNSNLKIANINSQLVELTERSKLSTEQYEGKLKRISLDSEEAAERSRVRLVAIESELQDSQTSLTSLTTEYRLFKERAESTSGSAATTIADLKADLREATAVSQRNLAQKDSQIAGLRTELDGVSARLEISESQRSQDAKVALNSAQEASKEAAQNLALLQERIRSLEAELSRTQQDLALAQNRIATLQEQLAAESGQATDDKRKTEGLIRSLREKLSQTEEDLRDTTTKATAERVRSQERLTELKAELVAAQSATREASGSSDRKLWEMEQNLSSSKYDTAALQEKLASAASRHAAQTQALQKSLDEEKAQSALRLERMKVEMADVSASLANLREESKADRAVTSKKEMEMSLENSTLISKVSTLTSQLKASQNAVMVAVEARNRAETSFQSQLQQLIQTKTREIEVLKDNHADAARSLAAAEERLEVWRKEKVCQKDEVSELEEKWERKLRAAEQEIDAANAHARQVEENHQRDLKVALSGVEGQLMVCKDREESLKQEKAALNDVMKVMQAQLRETNSNIGQLKAELRAKNRILEDSQAEKDRELNDVRSAAERKFESLQYDFTALEQKNLELRNALNTQNQQLRDVKNEIADHESTTRAQKAAISQHLDVIEKMKLEDKHALEVAATQEAKIREQASQLNQVRLETNGEVHELKARLQSAENKIRLVTEERDRLDKTVVELQSGDSQASRRVREDLERAASTKARAVEEKFRLETAALSTENRELKMKVQFLELQSTVNQNVQRDMSALRRDYEEKLSRLRQTCQETNSQLQVTTTAYKAFQARTESKQRQMEDDYRYQIARLQHEHQTKLARISRGQEGDGSVTPSSDRENSLSRTSVAGPRDAAGSNAQARTYSVTSVASDDYSHDIRGSRQGSMMAHDSGSRHGSVFEASDRERHSSRVAVPAPVHEDNFEFEDDRLPSGSQPNSRRFSAAHISPDETTTLRNDAYSAPRSQARYSIAASNSVIAGVRQDQRRQSSY